MARKHSTKARHRKNKKHSPQGYRSSEQGTPQQSVPKRRLTPLRVGLALGVLSIGAALWWGSLRGEASPAPAEPALAQPAPAQPALAKPAPAQPASVPLAQQLPPGAVPINTVDPMTGQAIKSDSPTTVYKGHVVAFCCKNSAAYKGGWDRMSEAEKDAFVRRYVK